MGTEGTPSSVVENPIHLVLYNGDLLSEISSWSTDCDVKDAQLRPLRVAQRCSQVCRVWRDLWLNSPNIWADIIDLTLLGRVDERWRDEVMVRTRGSPLSVKGTVGLSINKRAEVKFFITIFITNWSRVRDVDISVANSWAFHNFVWPWDVIFFRTPAPLLQRFKLTSSLPGEPTPNPQPLFSNIAPFLREIDYPEPLSNPSTNGALPQWLRNLRHLTMSPVFTTMQMVIDILRSVPLLESITLDGLEVGQFPPNLNDPGWYGVPFGSSIVLPHMRSIIMNSKLYGFGCTVFFLNAIVPRPDCSVVVENVPPSYSGTDLVDQRLKTFIRAISCYSMDTLTVGTTSLSVTDEGIRFRTDILSECKHLRHHGSPKFSISWMYYRQSHTEVTSVISWYPRSLMTGVRTVTLHPLSAQHRTYWLFAVLLNELPTIERLEASDATLAFLHKASKECRKAVFPSVSAILVTQLTENGRRRGINSPFLLFLQNRQIKTLEIADCDDGEIDWAAFDRFSGMEILGKSSSSKRHGCGSSSAHPVE